MPYDGCIFAALSTTNSKSLGFHQWSASEATSGVEKTLEGRVEQGLQARTGPFYHTMNFLKSKASGYTAISYAMKKQTSESLFEFALLKFCSRSWLQECINEDGIWL